jgi:hypothetical protein
MLNKKEKARLDKIEQEVYAALALIKTQKIRNDALILKNELLQDQIQELRLRLKVQDATL